MPSEIIPNLYIGNDKESEVFISDFTEGDMIVNCTTYLPFYCNNNVAKIRVPILDTIYDNVPLFQIVRDDGVLEKINKILNEGGRVFVHCQKGAQRSPAVVACYFIKYNNLTPKEAIEFIKAKRKEAFFWEVTFQRALDRFYDYVVNISGGP